MSNQTAEARGSWQQKKGELFELGRGRRIPLREQQVQPKRCRLLSRREGLLVCLAAMTLHGAAIYWVGTSRTPALSIVPPETPPMAIEFSQPAPPSVEPPPTSIPEPLAAPTPPVEDELAVKPLPPKPTSKHKPLAKPAPKPVEQPPVPSVAPQAIAPPAPPAPAPITPASANAGYLHNPAPEYPALAMRRGWEGRVMLGVHVLPSGKPSEIKIQKSSGRDQLDEAAISAVKRWSFLPARQGNDPVDGWVSVPIDFKLP